MPRWLICLLPVVALASGCAICSNERDCEYGSYGGSWERHDRVNGRVGSAFYNPGGPVRPAEPIIEGPPDPTPADEEKANEEEKEREKKEKEREEKMTVPVLQIPAELPGTRATRTSTKR